MKIKHRCPQCNFTSAIKNDIEKHVKTKHDSHPNCPFCHVGFFNLSALKHLIDSMHKEPLVSELRTNVITNGNTKSPHNRPCVFFLQPRGCKKGQSCDFSHDANRLQLRISKVPKLCYNGPTCNWKPSCRYVHLEDGETIPARAPRERGRRIEYNNQDFVAPDLTTPPPGYSPSLSSMTDFPGLPQLGRPSVFRQNPQFQ